MMSNANIYINLVEVVFCRQKFATGRHSIHKNNAQCSMRTLLRLFLLMGMACFASLSEFTWCVFTKIYRLIEQCSQYNNFNDIYPGNYPYFAGIKMQYLPLHTSLWVVQEHQGSWSLRNLSSKTLYPMVQVEELCYMWVYGISIAAISFVLFNSAVNRTCNLVCQTFLKGQACAHLLIGFCWFWVLCNFLNLAASLGMVICNRILWCLCLQN